MSTVLRAAGSSSARSEARRGPRLASRADYALTYALSALTALCGLAAFRLAHLRLGEAGFAEFALTRRALGFLVPLASLGLGVAVPRAVARRVARGGAHGTGDLLRGAVVVVVAAAAALAIVVEIWPRPAALVCVGSSHRADLARSLPPLAAALALATCIAGYCRGQMWIAASNGLQLACVGVIPNIVLLAVGTVDSFLLWSAAAVCGAALASLAVMPRSGAASGRHSLAAAAMLFRDGAPRTPGDLAYYGLLAAPAVVVARGSGLESGGEVAYALALLTLFQQLVAPLGTLLLPEAAALIHAGQAPRLRRRVARMLAWSLAITAALAAVVAAAAEPLIRFHLGTCSPALVADVRWIAAAAAPLNLFTCLRSVVDAGTTRAVSPALCLAALVVFALGVLAGGAPTATTTMTAFLAAVGVLATASLVAARHVLARSA
jgi:O-antigen/teichoic acid export membrane protein